MSSSNRYIEIDVCRLIVGILLSENLVSDIEAELITKEVGRELERFAPNR